MLASTLHGPVGTAAAACARVARGPALRPSASPRQFPAAARTVPAATSLELDGVSMQPVEGLSDSKECYYEVHRLRGNETDVDGQAFPASLANLMQECACGHVVAFRGRSEEGFALDPIMVEKGLIFVMTRLQLQIKSYPKWGHVVQVETYIQEEGRLAARRDFNLTNCTTGEVIGHATSTWVLVNMNTRRLIRIPPEMKAVWMPHCPDPPRHAVPADQAKLKLPAIDEPWELEGPEQVARRSDMDMNGHINNVAYIGWALETVPEDVYSSKRMLQLELDFKAECKAGDSVRSVASRVDPDDFVEGGTDAFVHSLIKCNGDDCEELIRCRTTWG